MADLARRARMSDRSFARRFVAETGTTPHRWLTLQRVLLAQRLLEDTDLGVDEVAERCGFGSGALLRHHFRKIVGVAPADYRRTFRAAPCPEPAVAALIARCSTSTVREGRIGTRPRREESRMTSARPRVAVIGAGPSGLYAAAALLASGDPVDVDVLDRLPAPYGLVRYGVAPDHVKMKSVIRVLQQPFGPARCEFLGGVQLGDGRRCRSRCCASTSTRSCTPPAARWTAGSASRARTWTVSSAPGLFVSWYCGHPDHVGLAPLLDRPGVAVVGAGNVALDVARVLARTAGRDGQHRRPRPRAGGPARQRGHATCTC